METYIIKIDVSDITYMSELTPPFPTTKRLYAVRKGGVKFAQTTYVHYHSVSCGLIKNEWNIR